MHCWSERAKKKSEIGITYFRSPDTRIVYFSSEKLSSLIKDHMMCVARLPRLRGLFTLARPWLPGPASIPSPDATSEDRNYVTSQDKRCNSSNTSCQILSASHTCSCQAVRRLSEPPGLTLQRAYCQSVVISICCPNQTKQDHDDLSRQSPFHFTRAPLGHQVDTCCKRTSVRVSKYYVHT